MNGILFLGVHSLDLGKYCSREDAFSRLVFLESFFGEISDSNVMSVRVPEDWSEQGCDGKTFWENLIETLGGNNKLLGEFSSQLERFIGGKKSKETSYVKAFTFLEDNVRDTEKLEYYKAIKGTEFWEDLPQDRHVSNIHEVKESAVFYLAEMPVDESSYLARCLNIFKNLDFHENFLASLKSHGEISSKSKYSKAPVTGISGFSKSVTKSLLILDSLEISNKSTQSLLSEIQAESGFSCSPEGRNNSRLKLSYNGVNVNCEFHIKINQNNQEDGVFYQDRIYFGFLGVNGDRRILVSHSGKHL